MDEEIKALVSRLAEYLKKSEQQLRCFHEYNVQVEGWFKGELLCFLKREKLKGRLPNFEREKIVHFYVGDKRKRMSIDMLLQFDEMDNGLASWVELKHWRIWQNNRPYGCCGWYFKHSTRPTVERLLTIPEDGDRFMLGDKFMLILFTENPGPEKWRVGVDEFNADFPRPAVCSLTNPGDYPDYFFLGLLHVCPKIEG